MTPAAGPLISAAALLVALMSLPAAALEPETCFSRQHQGAAVDVRAALTREAAAMMARAVRTERDCVLACCSEEVRPGARCNMAVFKANKQDGEDNCLLFHCPTETDCPLMKAPEGSNTYNIYKGLSHPPTLRPVAMTTSVQTTTTSAPTTTTTRPTSTTSTTTSTLAPPSTKEPPPPIVIMATMPSGTPPTHTTSTSTSTTSTTTTLGPPPSFTAKKPNKNTKKQKKPIKKVKFHPTITTTTQTAPRYMTSLPVERAREEVEHRNATVPKTTTTAPTTKTTSTTTTAPTTTTTLPTTTTTLRTTTITPTTTTTTSSTTSPTTSSTSTTTSPTTSSTTTTQRTSTTKPTTTLTAQPPSLIFLPKSDSDLRPGPNLNSSSSRGKVVAAQGALKGGVVAFMVLGLAVLTLALAVAGRKAMESFDRRHYTRLELNDLHYEI